MQDPDGGHAMAPSSEGSGTGAQGLEGSTGSTAEFFDPLLAALDANRELTEQELEDMIE